MIVLTRGWDRGEYWFAQCGYEDRELLCVDRKILVVRDDFRDWLREHDPTAKLFWVRSNLRVLFSNRNAALAFRLRYNVVVRTEGEV